MVFKDAWEFYRNLEKKILGRRFKSFFPLLQEKLIKATYNPSTKIHFFGKMLKGHVFLN